MTKPDTTETRRKLIHAATDYDRKQSRKRGYNIYALGQYFQRIDEVIADIEGGANVRAAIVAGFSGRLADVFLRALDLPITTNDEARGGSIYYQPVKLKS